jgi:beta-phosphoglucomutase-like phosphatase (HAD superfamily)
MATSFPVQAYFARVWADVEDLLEAECKLKAGVIEILDYLDDLGLPRAIATSNGLPGRRALSGSLRPSAPLSTRWSPTRRHAHKPNPDPYLLAAERLASIRPTAWRWRTPTPASAPLTRPA